jgi:diaminopimelate epimerase
VAGSAKVQFEKWQALGNDYLIIGESFPWELAAERVQRLCDPHFGIGADGILLLSRPEKGAEEVAVLRIFNPDGSEAELSGNGARQAALYLHSHGWAGDEFALRTAAGIVRPRITSARTCTMAIGRASTTSGDYPSGGEDGRGTLSAAGQEWSFQHVSIGNPQCAIEVAEGLEELHLGDVGPEIERNELFPNRTNVSFYRAEGDRVRARIFERGVGETLSSGTGASGAAVAAHLAGAPGQLTVTLDGGELEVSISDDLDIELSGWAEPICTGELSQELLDALERV